MIVPRVVDIINVIVKNEDRVTIMFLVDKSVNKKNIARVMNADLIAPFKRLFLKSKKSNSDTKKPFCCLKVTIFSPMLLLYVTAIFNCSLKCYFCKLKSV